MQAIRVQQTIKKSGELIITNLPVEKGQQVEILLLFSSKTPARPSLTARQLLNSELIGIWKDRTDITDSLEYARQLRRKGQNRTDVTR